MIPQDCRLLSLNLGRQRGWRLAARQQRLARSRRNGESSESPHHDWRLTHLIIGLIPIRDTAIQNCFSNTMIPSTSPFGVLRWLALVSVLPSAESVYLPRTLNSSAFPSTVKASPSHFAVALTEPVR